jgi:hypothetical protein
MAALPGSRDKWTAFLLSLAVPGAGQLWARRWSCLGWFTAAAALSVLPLPPAGQVAALMVLGLCSAEHAKRGLEPAGRGGAGAVSRVSCEPMKGTAVDLRIDLDVPRPCDEVWRIVADLPSFLCIDPFHARVHVLGPRLEAGASLVLEHRAFGFTFPRFGRLLRWDEGRGYAFSDLSARGPGRGFPHCFFVTVEPGEAARTWLRVRVRGRWTARWLPPGFGRWWLRYVCAEHARLLRTALS